MWEVRGSRRIPRLPTEQTETRDAMCLDGAGGGRMTLKVPSKGLYLDMIRLRCFIVTE